MNTAQLSTLFEQHKTAVLGSAAAAVAGLALIQRRKATAGAAGSTTVGARVPGTIPAAAIEPQSAGAYDSTSYDLYNALSGQLEQLAQTGSSTGAAQAPEPVSSSLFAPTGTGEWVRFADGVTAEVESDGSLFGLTGSQITALRQAGLKPTIVKMPGTKPSSLASTVSNISARARLGGTKPPMSPTPATTYSANV